MKKLSQIVNLFGLKSVSVCETCGFHAGNLMFHIRKQSVSNMETGVLSYILLI